MNTLLALIVECGAKLKFSLHFIAPSNKGLCHFTFNKLEENFLAVGKLKIILSVFNHHLNWFNKLFYNSQWNLLFPDTSADIIDFFPFHSNVQYSVFGSIMTIGALIGALLSGRTTDLIGRRCVCFSRPNKHLYI